MLLGSLICLKIDLLVPRLQGADNMCVPTKHQVVEHARRNEGLK